MKKSIAFALFQEGHTVDDNMELLRAMAKGMTQEQELQIRLQMERMYEEYKSKTKTIKKK